jgi:Skp family chaperone for outer membrane proteins
MAEPQQETWVKLVTLTVIVLAVASGVSAFKAIGYATRAQIFAAREARQWQDYQVESVYKDNFNIRRDILTSLKGSEGKAAKGAHKTLAAKIKAYEDEMGRLNQERDQIKKEAQTLAAQEDALEKRAGELGLAVILFQLAIMSSAVGALTRKKILWLVGLGLGAWGLVYLVKCLLL